jgi:hypothetical protein
VKIKLVVVCQTQWLLFSVAVVLSACCSQRLLFLVLVVIKINLMKIKQLVCLGLGLIALSAAPAMAQKTDDFGDKINAGKSTVNLKNLPVVANLDWRSDKADIPWSVPVLVRDDFEGDYLAVIDRNYQIDALSDYETGIITNWSRHMLRIYSYDSIKKCSFLFCDKKKVASREANKVTIKAGAAIFRIEGENGNFKISEELAMALRNAPAGDTKIKVQFEGSGVEVVNDIGKGTVQAWNTVYQDAAGAKEEKAAETKAPDKPGAKSNPSAVKPTGTKSPKK